MENATIVVNVKFGAKMLKLTVDPTITLARFREQLEKETGIAQDYTSKNRNPTCSPKAHLPGSIEG
jgi:hypothetical protein